MKRHPLWFLALLVMLAPLVVQGQNVCTPQNTTTADVVALDQSFYNNRLGAFQPGGTIFALRRDVVSNTTPASALAAGKVMLRPEKRPRPIVLRVNAGDCLQIAFQNFLSATPKATQVGTRYAGVHVMGLHVVGAFDGAGAPIEPISGDGSWSGANDIAAPATGPRVSGLVAPGEKITYVLHAPDHSDGSYLLYSTGQTNGAAPNFGGQLMQGLFGAVTVQPKQSEWYRSQVTRTELLKATYRGNGQTLTATNRTVKINGSPARVWTWTVPGNPAREAVVLNADSDPVPASSTDGYLHTTGGQPYVNYAATDDSRQCGGSPLPVLKLTNSAREICHSDLTAIITGPNAGLLIDPPYAGPPSTPNPREPFREFAIHYHDDFLVTQAFPQQQGGSNLANTLAAGRDFFAINYGIGAIGAEVLANRLGVGPMYQCATCKFEEFFLSSWTVGDPAIVVDIPANSGVTCTDPKNPNTCTVPPGPKATKAFYPDDPSNVYHSYVGDHVIFQILHAGTNITHVHHLHAQQWLHSPRNANSAYRDSQMISPGASYTLNHVYNGSGNVNKTVGDSIFHCHFYPHFAQGMWSMWRTHDAFEAGTRLDANGKALPGWNRALPDGEIAEGTPTPALVPLPTIPMAPAPARTRLVDVDLSGVADPAGYTVEVHPQDREQNPGYPFFIPGVAGQRAPHPPLDIAWDENADGTPKKDSSGKLVYLDGGLPRHISLYDPDVTEKHTRWDFTKSNGKITAVQLPEEGTATEKAAMAIHETRNHPSFTPEGAPAPFVLNGKPRKHGAPYANPNVKLDGQEHCREENTPSLVLDPKDGAQPCLIRYKAADIQIDAVFNKKGWHYPQTRLISLWGDVKDTIDNKRIPQPFFFRANSDQIIEYWLANLVPNYYELDDFQVRTPTDIIGQHIHLVKFDVTSSDGAGNGYNYEDGTFSPDEVRETIEAINQCPDDNEDCDRCPGGLFAGLNISGGSAKPTGNRRCLHPKPIPYFGDGPNGRWIGAQATIQRWAADPVFGEERERAANPEYLADDRRRIDRTLRTVFTHDHFGPSTHQQVGLYAGLVVEPKESYWLDGETGQHYGSNANRALGVNGLPPFDGGPTGWHANIIDRPASDTQNSYREFVLEFQDRQLAYTANSIPNAVPYDGGTPAYTGWSDPKNAISPVAPGQPPTGPRPPWPALVTNAFITGSYSVNYRNEPLTFRAFGGAPAVSPAPAGTDLSNAFASIPRVDPQLNTQPATGTAISSTGANAFKFPPPFRGAQANDPYTPLLRAYPGDNVQVRTLVGAHMSPHFFNMHGVNWLFEPAEEDSGWRSAQGMGISEHYEMIFNIPQSTGPTSDYLWETSSDTNGRRNGNWGLLRAYAADQPDLQRLPNNTTGADAAPNGCPPENLAPRRAYRVRALTIQQATGTNWLTYNARGQAGKNGGEQLVDPNAIIYVDEADLVDGRLKNPNRVEPLILRARAGECVQVTLTNGLPADKIGETVATRPPWPAQFTVNASSKEEGDAWQTAFVGAGSTTPRPSFYLSEPPFNFMAAFNAQNTFGYTLPVSSPTTNNGNNTYTITASGNTYTVSRAGDTAFTIVSAQPVQISTSRNVGLHASLLEYDVRDSDGMNVGANPAQTLAPGASKTYNWYAGKHIRDNDTWKAMPVEYGSVNLNPSDPLMQHPKGLFGALIIEPRTTTGWTVDENSKASAHVNYTEDDGTAKSFREFVTIIQDDIIGMKKTGGAPVQASPPNGNGNGNGGTAATLTIAGERLNNVNTWTLDGTQQANNSVYTVAPGDTVVFKVVSGRHGVAFTQGQAAFDAYFDVVSGGELLKANPNNIAGAWGTDAFNAPQDLVTLRVKSGATGDLPFVCTQHGTAMAGTMRVSAPPATTLTIAGERLNNVNTWTLNGTQQANNSVYSVSPGDTVVFKVVSGRHGVAFTQGQAAFDAYFDVVSGGELLKANPNNIAGAWGTDAFNAPQDLVTLRVKSGATGDLPFVCTQHGAAMAGTMRVAAPPATMTLAGDFTSGPVWSLNGVVQGNNATYSVKPGDIISVTSQNGLHGIAFTQGQAAFDAFFDVLSGGNLLIANPNGIPNSWGTLPVTGPASLLTLQVKPTATGSLPFECSQHKQNMAGTFQIGAPTVNHTITGDMVNGSPMWLLDGKPIANGRLYGVKAGDVIVFNVANGTHGITFTQGQTAFNNYFTVIEATNELIADPNGITGGWGTRAIVGPAKLITIQVKPTATGLLPFECTQHKQNMAGTFTLGSTAMTWNITGDIANNAPVWELNNVAQANNANYPVESGDTVVFSVATGRHGVTFITGRTAFESVFDVVSGGELLKADPNNIAGGWGTDAFNAPKALITVKVKPNVPPGNLPFWCTQHKAGMAGTFTVNGGVPALVAAPQQFTRAFNYKTEPLQYRYANPNFLDPATTAPVGISRAMSNQLVLADPQTPVFAAAAGEPVRIRMLHPAGLDEQVLTLHGHNWQEEPYVNGKSSSVIGFNKFSQNLGSRDAFGPNVSWDLVIDQAGGHAKTQGDYLFRTFIGTDFMFGLWGLMRVGEPGRDIVTVNYFPAPDSGAQFPAGMRGTATVNTSTGRMADMVEIFSGSAAGGTPADRVRIDKSTGFWSSTKTLPAPPLFVRSVICNDAPCTSPTPWGSRIAAAYIPTTGTSPAQAAQPMRDIDPGVIDLFKPERTNEIVQPPAPPDDGHHNDH
jgi:plastocyanin